MKETGAVGWGREGVRGVRWERCNKAKKWTEGCRVTEVACHCFREEGEDTVESHRFRLLEAKKQP